MPHITVKLWPGRSEADKKKFAQAVVDDAQRILGASPDWISVSIQEISPDRWDGDVYQPEILGKRDTLYKLPASMQEK